MADGGPFVNTIRIFPLRFNIRRRNYPPYHVYTRHIRRYDESTQNARRLVKTLFETDTGDRTGNVIFVFIFCFFVSPPQLKIIAIVYFLDLSWSLVVVITIIIITKKKKTRIYFVVRTMSRAYSVEILYRITRSHIIPSSFTTARERADRAVGIGFRTTFITDPDITHPLMIYHVRTQRYRRIYRWLR